LKGAGALRKREREILVVRTSWEVAAGIEQIYNGLFSFGGKVT